MNLLLVNGSLDSRPDSTINRIIRFLSKDLNTYPVTTTTFQLASAAVPLFDPDMPEPAPSPVQRMVDVFRQADAHIWLTPLYHGSLTGALKNCLDWLELSRTQPSPYLTDKRIGLVCVADGLQAMQGIQAMDAVAKALRA